MSTKERTIGIRLGDLTDLVLSFETSTGLSAGTLAKELLLSALTRWQKEGELKWPMVAVPKKEYEALLQSAPSTAVSKSDPTSGYAARKKASGGSSGSGPSGGIQARNAAAPLPTYSVQRSAVIHPPRDVDQSAPSNCKSEAEPGIILP